MKKKGHTVKEHADNSTVASLPRFRLSHITDGYTAQVVAPLPPKCLALPRISHTRRNLGKIRNEFQKSLYEQDNSGDRHNNKKRY